MSVYQPRPETIERDATTLLTILGRALRRLDEIDAHEQRPNEETFIGHCYTPVRRLIEDGHV